MERFQHRRSKSYQGNLQFRKRVDAPFVASDSSSYGGYLTEDDLFPFESRSRRRQETAEASIKKLLAEEMSKEMEAKRRPPSVIAKLMGLDALPAQSPVKKSQKKFSENYLQKTASIGSVEKSSSYDGRSLRMSNKEQQEFKDVYEVSEPSKGEKHSNMLGQKGMGNPRLSEAKMEFVRQKFLDVKRLSTDEKLQQSKEFHDALEVLDSNKDLLLKFLQEPDSLFTKHLQDLQSVPPRCQAGHITVLKSSNASGNANWKTDRKIDQIDYEDSVRKPAVQTVSHMHNKHGAFSSSKVPKSQLGEKDETYLVPTRIVVLKPNLRKTQNTERPASSSGSLGGHPSGHRKHIECQRPENLELFAEVRDRRSSSIEWEALKHRNRGSREISKEITRQMRHSLNSRRVCSSRHRGYAGDESSDSVSGNDSANEFELMTPTSRHFFDWKNKYSPSSSYSTESSVSREAKKRLSERWKMTHRCQEVGKTGRGSTLGEMLALPDRETRSTTLDSTRVQDVFTDTLTRNGVVTSCPSPLGISSRDGWKDGCGNTLSRSRSLPASSTVFASPKTSIRRGALGSDKLSMPKESGSRGSNKSRSVNAGQTEDFFPRSSSTRSRGKKARSFTFVGQEKHNTVQEAHKKIVGLSIKIEEENISFEEKHRTLELPDDDAEETIYVTDEIAVATPEEEIISCDSPQEQLSEGASIKSVNDRDVSSQNFDRPNPEIMPNSLSEEISLPSHSLTEVESPPSCKEAGQPSPDSVLEPCIEDVLPGSDSFEKVSADLHGLRMQLQLLKLESSDTYSDEFEMVVSSDEETEDSVNFLKENSEMNRDFTYVVDVLADSGIQDEDIGVLLSTRYCPEGLLGADLFENLEKKYIEQTAWPKSERRLLFNRVNSGLIEVLQPLVDPHPWVKLGKRLGHERRDAPLAQELWKFLVNQGKEEGNDPPESVLGNEVKWLDLGDDIDAVGREIERLLFGELIAEILMCEL